MGVHLAQMGSSGDYILYANAVAPSDTRGSNVIKTFHAHNWHQRDDIMCYLTTPESQTRAARILDYVLLPCYEL